jgi:hypothetical protein
VGAALVWSESGLAGLFGGSAGNGKTMAADVTAGEPPHDLYRVDLP